MAVYLSKMAATMVGTSPRDVGSIYNGPEPLGPGQMGSGQFASVQFDPLQSALENYVLGNSLHNTTRLHDSALYIANLDHSALGNYVGINFSKDNYGLKH